jgi:NADPH-dependent 2,4-dienoyl-CoA reductase/sulfur reductase-like enzyme/rhodanese-related sulfurtransferase
MSARRIVIVGGSAAGPKAAARAARLDPRAEVTLVQRDATLSMASCGYPYYLAGVFDDRGLLLSTPTGELRDPAFFAAAKGVRALIRTEALDIDRAAKRLACRDLDGGRDFELPYDKLIVCTGSRPLLPNIPGRELAGVATLHSLADADALKDACREAKGKQAVIAGGGLIGLETCEALVARGFQVAVAEAAEHVLAFLDPELAMLLENHLRAKGVRLLLSTAVTAFAGENGRLRAARLANGEELPCGLALLAVGARPNVDLARRAGLNIGPAGGIAVDAFLKTSDPDVYAAGDCIETVHRVGGHKTLAPYGDLANLEGRVAGENAVLGDAARFPGTTHSRICKVFGFTAGSTGLTHAEAVAAGFDAVSAVNAGPDKPGFMDGKLLVSKITADAASGRLLGFACLGPGNVNRQLAQAAMALLGGLTLRDLATADLPYAPPYSPAVDHLIVAAHILENKLAGRLNGLTSIQAKTQLDGPSPPVFLDVREHSEHRQMRLGIGETLIPIGQLRSNPELLPRDKNQAIVCYCKVSMRGYEAQLILNDLGYPNVSVMEGGIMAWPFGLAK